LMLIARKWRVFANYLSVRLWGDRPDRGDGGTFPGS